MDFRLLGLLTVSDGEEIAIGRGRERALLALLLLHRNEPLTTDRIVEELWGDGAPARAEKSVQVYVSRLRKVVGPSRIVTTAAGYVLNVGEGECDIDRFERHARNGHDACESNDYDSGERELTQALELSRGEPLADFPYAEWAQRERARLDELRRSVQADQIDARMALGRTGEIIGPLEALIAGSPFWERPREQLMVALYRSGRQAEALDLYRDTRRLFDEIGVEPGEELQQLERRILNHDPTLRRMAAERPAPETDAVLRVTVAGVDHLPSGRSFRRRNVTALAIFAALVVLAAGFAFVPRGRPTPELRPQSIVVFDPAKGRVTKDLRLDSVPGPIAVEGKHLWVVNSVDRTISEFDTGTLAHLRTIGLRSPPYEVVGDRHSLWLANAFDGTVSRLDTGIGVLSPPFRPEPRSAGRVAELRAFGSLWVGSQDNAVSRIDPHRSVLQAVIRGAESPLGLAATSTSIWAIEATGPTVLELSPRTNRIVRRIRLRGRPIAIVAAAGAPWVLTRYPPRLSRIDPASRRVNASTVVTPGSSALAAAAGRLWVVDGEAGTLTEIDPRTAARVRTNQIIRPLGSVVGDAGLLWLTAP
jgi:DNA-binding SARP family transcriptional activator/DNA-binding beta-propeller fold protein YncE